MSDESRSQPWCKVFAIGRGVLELPGLDWHIDGELGRACSRYFSGLLSAETKPCEVWTAPAPVLAQTAHTCAVLKIFRCRLKRDAQLG